MFCLPLKALNPGATFDPPRNFTDYTLRAAVRATSTRPREPRIKGLAAPAFPV